MDKENSQHKALEFFSIIFKIIGFIVSMVFIFKIESYDLKVREGDEEPEIILIKDQYWGLKSSEFNVRNKNNYWEYKNEKNKWIPLPVESSIFTDDHFGYVYDEDF